MNLVAAILRGHDNDTYMVASCRKRLQGIPDSVFCPRCGWKTDWRFVRKDYKLGKRRRDVSATYDGATIISNRVRGLLLSLGIEESVFIKIPLEPDFFVLSPDTVVSFDVQRRRTRLEEYCEACALYASVAGASPAFFKSLPQGDSWIARSDVLFGSFHEHHPLIVVSALLARALQSGSFSGLELETIKAEQ